MLRLIWSREGARTSSSTTGPVENRKTGEIWPVRFPNCMVGYGSRRCLKLILRHINLNIPFPACKRTRFMCYTCSDDLWSGRPLHFKEVWEHFPIAQRSTVRNWPFTTQESKRPQLLSVWEFERWVIKKKC